MIEQHSVSRRTSIKSLGALGAAIALGGTAAAQAPPESKASTSKPQEQAVNVVDVAVGRMTKGHS